MPQQTIFDILRDDHNSVLDLFEQIDAQPDDSERLPDLLGELTRQLRIHSRAEERAFYPALRDRESMSDLVREAETDHDQVEGLLEELRSFPVHSEDWENIFEEMRGLVEDHVAEEEDEIFDRMREELSDEELVQLAENFNESKEQAARQDFEQRKGAERERLVRQDKEIPGAA